MACRRVALDNVMLDGRKYEIFLEMRRPNGKLFTKIAWSGRVGGGWWIGKGLKGSEHSETEVQFRHFSAWTEEDHEIPQPRDTSCPAEMFLF